MKEYKVSERTAKAVAILDHYNSLCEEIRDFLGDFADTDLKAEKWQCMEDFGSNCFDLITESVIDNLGSGSRVSL